MNFRKFKVAVLIAVIAMASVCFAQNPAPTFRGAWSPTETYRGTWQGANPQGDTVSHGNFNGKPLFWYAKWENRGSTPGEFEPGGGTSPWVLINSASTNDRGRPNFQAVTWNGGGGSTAINNIGPMQARVPTWRDGARGAYTINLDDIGAMDFETMIQPAWDLAREFPDIKMSWGVFVERMSESDWNNAVKMVAEGHEMFSHSFHHTSAADQWQWFYPTQRIPSHDPAIPAALRGLTVVGTWHPNFAQQDQTWPIPPGATATFESDLVSITGPTAGWTTHAPNTAFEVQGNFRVTPKAGVMAFQTIPGEPSSTVYIRYTNRHEALNPDGSLKPEWEEASKFGSDIVSEGVIAATGTAWWELSDFANFYAGSTPAWVTRDQGAGGFIAKIFCKRGWDGGLGVAGPDSRKNIDTANWFINRNIYERITTAGEYFAKGKRNEFYGYPFDAFSEKTHELLFRGVDANYTSRFVGARGGAKSGKPMSGDFFHPFRIDFDAFYIMDRNWTVNTSHKTMDPAHPHQLLGLNEMVDDIIAANGYMIRELHAIPDIPGNAWHSSEAQADMWPINNIAKGMGGWWGGLTKNMLREHLTHVQSKIASRDLTVFTPSEAVKYRLTANEFETNANLTAIDTNWSVSLVKRNTAGQPIDDIHKDEITVIVNLGTPVARLAVAYDGNPNNRVAENSPRRRPRPMDIPHGSPEGTPAQVWSVSINPFRTADHSALLIRNAAWFGQDIVYDLDIPIAPTGIRGGAAARRSASTAAFTGINNGQINLHLSQGNYTVQLFNVQGRLINSVNINAVNGINATGLRTDHLARGLVILQVRDAQGAQVLQRRLILGR